MDPFTFNNNFAEEDNNATAEALSRNSQPQAFQQGTSFLGGFVPPSSEAPTQSGLGGFQENFAFDSLKQTQTPAQNLLFAPQMGSHLQNYSQLQQMNNQNTASNIGNASMPSQGMHQSDDISGLLEQQQLQALANLERQNQILGMNVNNGVTPTDFQFYGSGAQSLGLGNLSGNQLAGFSNMNMQNMQANMMNPPNFTSGQQQSTMNSFPGCMPMQNTLYLNGANAQTPVSITHAQQSLHNTANIHTALQNTLQQSLQGPTDASNQGMGVQMQLPPEIKRKGRGRSSTFPLKLHQMLMDLEEQDGGTSIASFLPHGKSFMIHKPKEFAGKVMPNYFRMSSYSSFQRQLNLYDFQRISDGPEKGAYLHEYFIKNKPMLSSNMKRSKIKGMTRAKQDERLETYERQKQML